MIMQDKKGDEDLAYAKLRPTIPKEPAFVTAQRAQRMRFLSQFIGIINLQCSYGGCSNKLTYVTDQKLENTNN